MTETEHTNLALVREYLAALERGEAGEPLARFFAPDVIQIELPNRLNPGGQRSDLASILSRSVQGRSALSSQRYEIVSELAGDERVAVEAQWVGMLAIPLGALAAGAEIRAHLAMFFECRQGRIVAQHNYDCFEPW